MGEGQFDAGNLRELFEPCGHVTVKRMFGGHGLYQHGLIFGLTYQGDIYLKVDEGNLRHFVAEDLAAFVYDPGNGRKPITMPYRRMPETCFDDQDAMRTWVGRSVDAARRSALAKPRKAKPASAGPAGFGEME